MWFKKEKVNNPLGFNNVLKGRYSDVKYLVYHSYDSKDGEVVVFVDKEIDFDWEVDGAISSKLELEPLKSSVGSVLNKIAKLEPESHSWPSDLKITSKRLLGEMFVRAINGDDKGAIDAFHHAEDFLNKKGAQVSRFWTLQSCLAVGCLSFVGGAVEVYFKVNIIDMFGREFFLLTICFFAGCVGAVLFVLMRFKTQIVVDASAGKTLHYLEGIARIVGGGVAGVLVGSMVRMGILLPIFSKVNLESMAMFASAMIAGASERLAAGIVTKVENSKTP